MDGLLYTPEDGGLLHFLAISVVIGGVMAFAAGRAIASTWRPYFIVPVYMIVLAAAVRFLHYALAGEDLLDLQYFVVAFIIALLCASYGYRAERVRQMTTQYSWLYRRSGPISWQAKA